MVAVTSYGNTAEYGLREEETFLSVSAQNLISGLVHVDLTHFSSGNY
jgi:hypothetical protein